MSNDDIMDILIDALSNIAPDVDMKSVNPDASLREAMDIDSMDFLNFIMAVHKKLGIDIPERDYPKLATLNGAAAYLTGRVKKTAP
jgi:acyl carrier protein